MSRRNGEGGRGKWGEGREENGLKDEGKWGWGGLGGGLWAGGGVRWRRESLPREQNEAEVGSRGVGG